MRGHASTRGVPHLMEKTPKFRNIFFLGREVASMLLRKRSFSQRVGIGCSRTGISDPRRQIFKGDEITLRSCRPAEKTSGLPENKRKRFPDWVEQVNRGREELVTALLGFGLFGV
jgi:hypothetical protein